MLVVFLRLTSSLFQGRASLEIPNLRGETAASMLQNYVGSVWVSKKVGERVRDALATSRSRNCLNKIKKDEVTTITEIVCCQNLICIIFFRD